MTGAGSARSSDCPPPNPARVSPIGWTSDGPETGPRDPTRFSARDLRRAVVSARRPIKERWHKGRNCRGNFEPPERQICSATNGLVAGCAGSPLRTRLRTKFPVRRETTGNFSKNRGFRAMESRKLALVQRVSGEIPYAKEQGIFSILAGNIREISGI
jgi:hypothetical protein